MKNKVFVCSFISALIVNALFFKVIHIKSPKIINITESEVYLLDDVSGYEGDDASSALSAGTQRVTSSFSLPGVYQKISTAEMNYRISTIKDDSVFQEYDPFKEDQKLVSGAMDFTASVEAPEMVISDDIRSREEKCLGKWLPDSEKRTRIILTENLRHYFDEDVINREIAGSGLNVNTDLNIQVLFFNEDSFSVLVEDENREGGIKSMITMIFHKAFKKTEAVPGRILGRINLRRMP